MKLVGRILEIWRYPVSSVGGEAIPSTDLTALGVVGDRQYGLIDAVSGLPAAPEKDRRWGKALFLEAKYVGETLPTIFFPSGHSYPITDRSLNGALCEYFGFAVAVASYDHTVLRLGLPLTQFRHRHFPLHLLTTASLNHLATLQRVTAVDFRRFRPTFLIETRESEGFLEGGWMSKRLRLGAIDLTVREETKRCGMIVISQPGLDEDPELLRNILRHNKRHLGVCCSIHNTGTVHVGDGLFI